MGHRILGLMHMTRKIASEEQDESMADIEPPPPKSRKPYNHWRMFNLKAKDSCNKPRALEMLLMMLLVWSWHRPHRQHFITIFNNRNSNIYYNIIITSLQWTHNHCEVDYNTVIVWWITVTYNEFDGKPPRSDQPLYKDQTSCPQCGLSSEVSLYIMQNFQH